MKIEKLNYNTLKIILTVEELSLKNITTQVCHLTEKNI